MVIQTVLDRKGSTAFHAEKVSRGGSDGSCPPFQSRPVVFQVAGLSSVRSCRSLRLHFTIRDKFGGGNISRPVPSRRRPRARKGFTSRPDPVLVFPFSSRPCGTSMATFRHDSRDRICSPVVLYVDVNPIGKSPYSKE